MIKHLRLLELYLTTSFDRDKARKEMRCLYYRFLTVAELAFLLITTPAAFIAINGLLAWLIIVSIHLIPRWRECGYELRFYFLPLLVLMTATAVLLPLMSPVIGEMFENFVVILKKPILLILFGVLLLVIYGLQNTETENTPRVTLAKNILSIIAVLFFLLFAVNNPLRDWIAASLF